MLAAGQVKNSARAAAASCASSPPREKTAAGATGNAVGVSARGFGDQGLQQQRQEDAGQPDRDARRAPAVVLRHVTADQRDEQVTERQTARVHRQRAGAARARVVIRNQGMRAGRAAGLSDAHADARREQLQERAGHGEQRGERGPQRQREAENRDAVEALRQPRDRNAADGIERGEGGAGEQAELRVGELQVHLHRLPDDGDQAALRGVAGVDQHQHPEHQAAVARRALGRRR